MKYFLFSLLLAQSHTNLWETFDRELAETPFQPWGGGRAVAGVSDSDAVDQRALSLILPKGSEPSPTRGANVSVRDQLFQFGTFEARLKTPTCTTKEEGVVSGFFTYFNDGSDANGNGIADNSEIDFEWLCAEPESIYLTLWTDYEDATARMKRVVRKINLAKGVIEYTRYGESFGTAGTQDLSGTEATPGTIRALADYNSAARYYEYGFTWTARSVVWWVVDPRTAEKIILWNYQGPETRVTQVPARFLFNLWHSNTWAPEARPNALAAPASDLDLRVDWVRIR